jgi:hypothetical protein
MMTYREVGRRRCLTKLILLCHGNKLVLCKAVEDPLGPDNIGFILLHDQFDIVGWRSP